MLNPTILVIELAPVLEPIPGYTVIPLYTLRPALAVIRPPEIAPALVFKDALEIGPEVIAPELLIIALPAAFENDTADSVPVATTEPVISKLVPELLNDTRPVAFDSVTTPLISSALCGAVVPIPTFDCVIPILAPVPVDHCESVPEIAVDGIDAAGNAKVFPLFEKVTEPVELERVTAPLRVLAPVTSSGVAATSDPIATFELIPIPPAIFDHCDRTPLSAEVGIDAAGNAKLLPLLDNVTVPDAFDRVIGPYTIPPVLALNILLLVHAACG